MPPRNTLPLGTPGRRLSHARWPVLGSLSRNHQTPFRALRIGFQPRPGPDALSRGLKQLPAHDFARIMGRKDPVAFHNQFPPDLVGSEG